MKTTTKTALCIVVALAVSASAQLATNLVPHATQRLIKGEKYDLEADRTYFKTISGKVEEIHKNAAAVRRYKPKPVSDEEAREFRRNQNSLERIGGYTSGASSPYLNRPLYPADLIWVTNCTVRRIGDDVSYKALPVGQVKIDGRVLDAFDCGTPVLMQAISERRKESDAPLEKNDKAFSEESLASDQQDAKDNDPEGLFRMAERFQFGRGVPKDQDKAVEYYRKAAALGNSHAKTALKRLQTRGGK